ncbi:MAG: amidohydrolase family protein [Bacteroidota bacterium]
MRKFYLLFAILLWLGGIHAQQRQPKVNLSDSRPDIKVFTHAMVQVDPTFVLENATIVVREGKITAIGTGISIPEDAVEIDLSGKWIYPAFIDAWSHLGVPKVKRAPRPPGSPSQFLSSRKGPYHWNDAVNTHEVISEQWKADPNAIKNHRAQGFAVVHVAPNDGILRGSGGILPLHDPADGPKWINDQLGGYFSFRKGSSNQSYPSSLMGAIALIRQFLLDVDHYRRASKENGIAAANLSFEAFLSVRNQNEPLFFETGSYLDVLRASQISKEFSLPLIYVTKGDSYRRIEEIQQLQSQLVVPVAYPQGYELSETADTRNVSLGQLRAWDQAPANLAFLAQAGVPFSITMHGLKKPGQFMAHLKQAMAFGLTEEQVLAGLTTTPAKLLGIDDQTGSLEQGKMANFFITNEKLFRPGAKIHEVYVQGVAYPVAPDVDQDARGRYEGKINSLTYRFEIGGSPGKPNISWYRSGDTLKGSIVIKDNIFVLTVNDTANDQTYYLTALKTDKGLRGSGENAQGIRVSFLATQTQQNNSQEEDPGLGKVRDNNPLPTVHFPNKAYGWEALPETDDYLIHDANVWTCTEDGLKIGIDVLVKDGKIAEVGPNLQAPDGIRHIDGKGLHLTPGIIDEHSHIAISRGVNEGTHSVTAEVRIGDVINPEDINIYRQLAGGVTTSQLLHGSANPIGGQSAIIKLRWGQTPEGMKFEGAPGFIKFALGENVKQSNWGGQYKTRYPKTRMGVEQMIQDAFREAKDYRRAWEAWEKSGKKAGTTAPRRDLQLDALLEILDGVRHITCHSYVQSEITMLMRLAESEGFRINTFTHILEGYKIADKLAAHGATGSTFSDWWAYKLEVMDAIPYNSALMHEQGVNVCVNSDDAEMGRRLNQEAAKAIRYGGVSEEAALRMVTLNPAKALKIDHRVGSIEVGKDADLVLWTDEPLSVNARVLYTWIDGKLYFDHEVDEKMREDHQKEKARLIQKMRSSKGGKSPVGDRSHQHSYHCDDLDGGYLDY